MAVTDEHGNWIDPQGTPVPRKYVDKYDKTMDKTVNKIVKQAQKVSDQLIKFKGLAFGEVEKFLDNSEEVYGISARNKGGNKQLTDFSNSCKVEVKVHKQIDFDDRLRLAKELIDECITTWSDGARDELKAVVNSAFDVDKRGNLNRERILGLRKIKIKDPQWTKAMDLIAESIKVVGRRAYIKISIKDEKGNWISIPLDIADC